MNFIKDAITRVGRSARQLESFTTTQKTNVPLHSSEKKSDPKVVQRPDRNLTNAELHKFKPLVKGYQRKVYQNFLEPLQISNLKVFNDNLPKYNSNLAKFIWVRKTNQDTVNVFNNFLEDRAIFNKMIDLLIDITPEHLKSNDLNNAQTLTRILQQQHEQDNMNKFSDITPRYHFHEIPPMPPLEPEAFQKYVYFLTHLKILYKNSLSLQNGLVSDILLHTHKITNTDYKPYRSVHTYNYLIKFFGYDKNQSSFARELLLVMNKDGHRPNIDTINNLLKLCQTHSRIRSISNTYQIIIKYLKLSKSLNIDINLTTWSRIYDLINNIFLKELFINKMISINLPILKNLSIRILDDFMDTTKDTSELIAFIENDLQVNWRQDSKFLNKVIYHKAINTKDDKLEELWAFVNSCEIDSFSVKYLFEGILKNKHISNTDLLLVSIYSSLDSGLYDNPDIYKLLILSVCQNKNNYDLAKITFILRGLIQDATMYLGLPLEVTEYESSKTVSENFKIIKRLVGFKLTKFEGQLAIQNRNSICTPLLLAPLSTDENNEWCEFKAHVKQTNEPMNPQLVVDHLHIGPCTVSIPDDQIRKYEHYQNRKAANARDRDRLYKLQQGIDNYTVQQMTERGIVV